MLTNNAFADFTQVFHVRHVWSVAFTLRSGLARPYLLALLLILAWDWRCPVLVCLSAVTRQLWLAAFCVGGTLILFIWLVGHLLCMVVAGFLGSSRWRLGLARLLSRLSFGSDSTTLAHCFFASAVP